MILETLAGAITGLIGNGLTAWTNYKTQKLKNEHDQKMFDFKLREIDARANAAIRTAEAKVNAEVEMADAGVYKESQKVGNRSSLDSNWITSLLESKGRARYITVPIAMLLITLLGFIDVLRGFMRPGITLYLTGLTTILTYRAYEILKEADLVSNTTQILALYSEVTSIVIYLTVSCVTWHFGDRSMSKFLTRLKEDNKATEDNRYKDIKVPAEINIPSNNDNAIPK